RGRGLAGCRTGKPGPGLPVRRPPRTTPPRGRPRPGAATGPGRRPRPRRPGRAYRRPHRGRTTHGPPHDGPGPPRGPARTRRPRLAGGHDHAALALHTAALPAAEQLTAPATTAQDPPVAEPEHAAGAEHPVGDRERAILRTAVGVANWRLGHHTEATAVLARA